MGILSFRNNFIQHNEETNYIKQNKNQKCAKALFLIEREKGQVFVH